MTGRLVIAAALVAAAGCGAPERVPFSTAGEAEVFAVLELDEDGALVAATGLQPFDGSASVFTRPGRRAVAVGWSGPALAAVRAPGPEDLAAAPPREATGCQPRLPRPSLVVDLDDGASLDPGQVPELTTEWLSQACPEVEPSDISVDVTCKKFRCPLTTTRTAACAFELDLDCDIGPVAATVWPRGEVCLEPPEALTCEATTRAPPRAASYACEAPEPCRIDVYAGPATPLDVQTIQLRDAPEFAPPPDLIGQLVLPPSASRFFGYAHDLTISEGKVAVSLGPGLPFTSCAAQAITRGSVEIFDVDTLARTATAAVQGCLTRLAPAEGGFVGLRDTLRSFELVRLSERGEAREVVPADPRAAPGPGEPPMLHTPDARATVFERVGDHLVAAVVTATPRGTKVFTWHAQTLEPQTRAFVEGATIVAGAPIDASTVALAATARSGYHTVDVRTGRVSDLVPLPADLVRDDNVSSDVAWSARGQRALLTLSRKNASLLGMDATGVRSRAVLFDTDARPMAARPWAGRALALVVATRSTDQVTWPTSLHTYDLETERFLPGPAPVGHGAPGRMLEDEGGRIWVLLPWQARLLRVGLR